MHSHYVTGRTSPLWMILVTCGLVGCTTESDLLIQKSLLTMSPDMDTITTIEVRGGRAVGTSTESLPSDAHSSATVQRADKPLPVVALEPKIHPELEALITDAEGKGQPDLLTRPVEAIITYREDQILPRLFPLIEDEPRESAANVRILNDNRRLLDALASSRAGRHQSHFAQLASTFGATQLKESAVIVNSVLVEMPIGRIRLLAAQPDVQYVELNTFRSPPPGIDMVDVRTVLVSDPYFGQTGSLTGLLDTGVMASHQLLIANIRNLRDCVNGTSNFCQNGSNLDPSDSFWNHGTGSASEIMAGSILGNTYRGITQMQLDSYKVYDNVGSVPFAVQRAFLAALQNGNRLIVVNVQHTGGPAGVVSQAADNAAIAFATVVSAAGDFGPGSATVRSPGDARQVLAVGAQDLASMTLESASGRGPTTDGRTKPDVLGLSNIRVADTGTPISLKTYGLTSAATPNVGGVMALMRNFIKSGFDISPGHVYAFAIMMGQGGHASDNSRGAGLILSPTNGTLSQGVVTVGPGGQVNIPITMTSPMSAIDVAIWWPETSTQTHSDVDLSLNNPSGVPVLTSGAVGSVFEKVHVTSSLVPGTWTVQVVAFSVSAPQTVYWTVFKRN